MRISTEETDIGYTEESWRYGIFLNGVPVSLCILADEEGGFVERFKEWDSLKALVEGTELLYGNVEIVELKREKLT